MNPYIQYMYSYPHKTAYRQLSGVSLRDYVHLLKGGGHGMYVHLPFCQAKCGYCNLFSVTGQSPYDVETYLDTLERQCIQYAALLKPEKTVFSELVIGGGTPLYLSEKQLLRMFGMLRDYFMFSKELEIIVETAPNQTDAGKLDVLKLAGVTRVSMGIQSFQDEELAALGRRHRAQTAREALHLLQSMDFACVNVDFIYGIPGQTVQSLLESLKEALAMEPDEIFLYPLYVKHGAVLEGQGVVPDSAQAYEQYLHASGYLRSSGFRQDSMRRFVHAAQAGQRAYAECGFGTSLALGCGGRSYLGNLHFCTPYAITRDTCLARLAEYEQTTDFTQITHGLFLSAQEMQRRYVIRHLLILPGVWFERYEQVFGSRALEDFPQLRTWMDSGFAALHETDRGTFLALTETGMGLSDALGPQLISPQMRAAMEEWERLQAVGNG